MKRVVKRMPLTAQELIAVADHDARFVPMNPHGTVLWDRETRTGGFAQPTPAGAREWGRQFRKLAARARAARSKP